MRRLIALLRQPAADRALLVRAVWHVLRARRDVRRWAPGMVLPRNPDPAEFDSGSASLVRRSAAAVDRVVGPILGSDQCLVRARALQRLLAAQGIPSALHIGVRKEQGRIRSHAWLESGREVVIGRLPDLETYEPLQGPTRAAVARPYRGSS